MSVKPRPTALVLSSGAGALTVARSLGTFGVQVTCADPDLTGYAMRSRYCHEKLLLPDFEREEEGALQLLEEHGERQALRPILYPMSDQYVLFVSKHRERLLKYYDFVLSDHDCLERLINKLSMFEVAREHDLPVPLTRVPKSRQDALSIGKEIGFPCLLKTAYSHGPLKQTDNNITKIHSLDELEEVYGRLSAIDPDLLIQEYIPGEDDNVHIFAGYFDGQGEPRLTFTGRKIRQSPINFGRGSICECAENKRLEETMISFCRSVGYLGNIDVGLKWDPVEGVYKVLDINPRLGMNHRTFVTRDKRIDMVRAAYLDLTEGLPRGLEPRLGRKWVIVYTDLRSSLDYMRAGRLTFKEWMKSYKGVEEAAVLSLKDWKPWLMHDRTSFWRGVMNRVRQLFRAGPRPRLS